VSTSAAEKPPVCPRCLDPDHTLIRCPYVKAVQFRPDGTIARAEFLTPADLPATPPSKKVDDAADGSSYPRKESK
jgi:hypothetical protein